MSFCELPSDLGIFANTSLPNLFIQEYMIKAPGDYVKVYIYGWMHSVYPSMAEPTSQRFAASLHMDLDTVERAFTYWRSKGLVRENSGKYEFLDVRNTLFDIRASNDSRIYEHAALSNSLAQAAGTQELTKDMLEMLYDLHDIDGFDEEALIKLIRYCSESYKGKKFTKSRIESVAREWKNAGITTSEKAAEYCTGLMLRNSPANKILNEMGITKRNVSIDEHNLYLKWTETLGFSLEAVRVAREGMTGSQNPNFKYLDKRIKTLFDRGLNTAKKIRDGEATKNELDEYIQACTFRLGIVGVVTDERRKYYSNWINGYCMNHEAILMICDEVNAQGNASFKAAESLISSYARRGLNSPEAILRERKIGEQFQRVLNATGVSRLPTEADKVQLEKWLEDFSMEIIMYAAEISRESSRPIGYMTRVLDDWKRKGLSTLQQVQTSKANHSSQNKGISKVHYSNERDYSSSELDYLIEDMSKKDILKKDE